MLKLEQIICAAKTVAEEYNIKSMILFGSYADGSCNPESDVDLMVEFFSPAVSLLTLSAVKNRMAEMLQKEVDLIRAPIPDNSVLEIGKVVQIYAA